MYLAFGYYKIGNARFIWSDMQLAIDFGDQPNCFVRHAELVCPNWIDMPNYFVRIGLTCRITLSELT